MSDTVTINIDVTRKAEGGLLPGTFKQPFASVRVKEDTLVQWQLVNGLQGDTFIISFRDGSPFDRVNDVSGSSGRLSPAQKAERKGDFHYKVYVVEGGTGVVFSIRHCPQLTVDDR